MNGTIIKPSIENETDVLYVQDATFYLTEKYATDLYNSCANVQFGVLCGTLQCNLQEFLDFQGNPFFWVPFPMRYLLFNDSRPIFDGITPLNDSGIYKFYKCNETVEGLGKCSCLDCPAVNSALPTFPEIHSPFWTTVESSDGTPKTEPFYRTELLIVKAKPFVKGINYQPAESVNTTWTFGPVFNITLLKEV